MVTINKAKDIIINILKKEPKVKREIIDGETKKTLFYDINTKDGLLTYMLTQEALGLMTDEKLQMILKKRHGFKNE